MKMRDSVFLHNTQKICYKYTGILLPGCNMFNNFLHGILYFIVATMACAGYAYYVNTERSEDDPKKRQYHPVGILFAPITLPLLLLSSAALLVLRVLIYGGLIVLFAIALLLMRKPFLLAAVHKVIMRIGETLLQAYTFLVSPTLRSLSHQPHKIRIPASQGSL